jgi:uncharacterized membrane protein affecting hemolysin expression
VPVQTGLGAIGSPSYFSCAATATDHLSIKAMLSGYSGILHTSIYDIEGRLVSTGGINNEQNNFLSTEALSCGHYILTISDANGIIFTHRFAKVNM